MASNIKMTKAEALSIQEQQIHWYCSLYGDGVRDLVRRGTDASALVDDMSYDIATINRHVPRGGQIEHIIAHSGLRLLAHA